MPNLRAAIAPDALNPLAGLEKVCLRRNYSPAKNRGMKALSDLGVAVGIVVSVIDACFIDVNDLLR